MVVRAACEIDDHKSNSREEFESVSGSGSRFIAGSPAPILLFFSVLRIHKSSWRFVLLSAILQILIFPLPRLYFLCWIALAPLLVALLRTSAPRTLQLDASQKLNPATPLEGFVLGYACGIVWYLGSCYWIYDTMHQYGGMSSPVAGFVLVLFSLYLALYHGAFGLLVALLARKNSYNRVALLASPFLWVAVELARTRVTGFPWDLLGTSQVDNIPLTRIATVTGVYGLSLEIMLVNAAFAATYLVRRNRRKVLLIASVSAAVLLQAGRLVNPPPLASDHIAVLLQQNLPVGGADAWTKSIFESTLQEFTQLSLHPTPPPAVAPDLILWPESPAPFYSGDPIFREALTNLARESHAWIVAGSIGIENPRLNTKSKEFNSAQLVSPSGEWLGRYDKIHLVPFGEYVPFRTVFAFAAGLTEAVGDFTHGSSRVPLAAGDHKLGVFICYESIFPGEVRQLTDQGAELLVNISNDGWYGDSGAWAQHLNQARMRAIENNRWLLRDTNTGLTASIDPYGRVVASIPRHTRGTLVAPYSFIPDPTLYSQYGDWLAWLCAIISCGAIFARFAILPRTSSETHA
jgi:apolipoprotein N-acyltransferase